MTILHRLNSLNLEINTNFITILKQMLRSVACLHIFFFLADIERPLVRPLVVLKYEYFFFSNSSQADQKLVRKSSISRYIVSANICLLKLSSINFTFSRLLYFLFWRKFACYIVNHSRIDKVKQRKMKNLHICRSVSCKSN